MNTNKLQEFLDAAGATSEMAKVFYDSFINVGFENQQALDLTKAVLINQLQIGAALGIIKEKEGEAE
jgi:hypothetical protein